MKDSENSMKTITTMASKELRLPQNVSMPVEISINGKLTGDKDEVVVIRQHLRQIFKEAYVCHITNGPLGLGIYDMPNSCFIKADGLYLRGIGDFMCTMVCETEIPGHLRMNWL